MSPETRERIARLAAKLRQQATPYERNPEVLWSWRGYGMGLRHAAEEIEEILAVLPPERPHQEKA